VDNCPFSINIGIIFVIVLEPFDGNCVGEFIYVLTKFKVRLIS
jgi:hypothetical protein